MRLKIQNSSESADIDKTQTDSSDRDHGVLVTKGARHVSGLTTIDGIERR